MTVESIGHHETRQYKTELIQQLLNEFQHDFPLSATPYADMASKLGITEEAVLGILSELKDQKILSRVGAVFRPNRIGASTLAAMAVPQGQLYRIAGIVSAHKGVNHKYERSHRFNLWFVATAPDQDDLNGILQNIEAQTCLKIMDLPMLESYHIDLGFDLNGRSASLPPRHHTPPCLAEPLTCTVDRQLLWALESGLAFTQQPYEAISETLSIPVKDVLTRIARLQEAGAIKRFGVVVRHHELGYKSNAMVVWNIAD